ncbi:MAG: hypothetical protein JXA49_06260 [Actinobacteria bacterium]|nr:hypothetical protein [Actinomycetota bacterium]
MSGVTVMRYEKKVKPKCPYCVTCPVFECFRIESTRNVFINLYCWGNFHKCERMQARGRGEAVPDNLLPNGFIFPTRKATIGNL